jgi:hypothetical protein
MGSVCGCLCLGLKKPFVQKVCACNHYSRCSSCRPTTTLRSWWFYVFSGVCLVLFFLQSMLQTAQSVSPAARKMRIRFANLLTTASTLHYKCTCNVCSAACPTSLVLIFCPESGFVFLLSPPHTACALQRLHTSLLLTLYAVPLSITAPSISCASVHHSSSSYLHYLSQLHYLSHRSCINFRAFIYNIHLISAAMSVATLLLSLPIEYV